jgi:hypothetical protein
MAAGILANLLLGFANMWDMPLMMLIAGTAVWYSLRKRTTGQFAEPRPTAPHPFHHGDGAHLSPTGVVRAQVPPASVQ